jgi:hypothetical protein
VTGAGAGIWVGGYGRAGLGERRGFMNVGRDGGEWCKMGLWAGGISGGNDEAGRGVSGALVFVTTHQGFCRGSKAMHPPPPRVQNA